MYRNLLRDVLVSPVLEDRIVSVIIHDVVSESNEPSGKWSFTFTPHLEQVRIGYIHLLPGQQIVISVCIRRIAASPCSEAEEEVTNFSFICLLTSRPAQFSVARIRHRPCCDRGVSAHPFDYGRILVVVFLF